MEGLEAGNLWLQIEILKHEAMADPEILPEGSFHLVRLVTAGQVLSPSPCLLGAVRMMCWTLGLPRGPAFMYCWYCGGGGPSGSIGSLHCGPIQTQLWHLLVLLDSARCVDCCFVYATCLEIKLSWTGTLSKVEAEELVEVVEETAPPTTWTQIRHAFPCMQTFDNTLYLFTDPQAVKTWNIITNLCVLM